MMIIVIPLLDLDDTIRLSDQHFSNHSCCLPPYNGVIHIFITFFDASVVFPQFSLESFIHR